MARVRRLLRHLRIEEAKRKRRCYGNKQHAIQARERCLVIENPDFPGVKNYCLQCADNILDQLEADMWTLRDKLFRFTKSSWRAYVIEKDNNGKISEELKAEIMFPDSTSMGRAPMQPNQPELPLDQPTLEQPPLATNARTKTVGRSNE